jgi:hypothetical protein
MPFCSCWPFGCRQFAASSTHFAFRRCRLSALVPFFNFPPPTGTPPLPSIHVGVGIFSSCPFGVDALFAAVFLQPPLWVFQPSLAFLSPIFLVSAGIFVPINFPI